MGVAGGGCQSVVFETKIMMELQVLVMTKVRCDPGSKKPR